MRASQRNRRENRDKQRTKEGHMHRYTERQDRGTEKMKAEEIEYDTVQDIRGNAIKKGKSIFK